MADSEPGSSLLEHLLPQEDRNWERAGRSEIKSVVGALRSTAMGMNGGGENELIHRRAGNEGAAEDHHHKIPGTHMAASGMMDDSKVADMTEPTGRYPMDITTTKGGAGTIEDAFKDMEVPRWQDQVTVRALFVSLALGTLFCIIAHKLMLTVGVLPSLNISAGLLGFFFIRLWTTVTTKMGFVTTPFTRQENTVIQTCVVACYGLVFSGGFGSYLLGMNQRTHDMVNTAKSTGGDIPGNENVKNPELTWIIGFLFVVSFIGIFSIVTLRKIMILDYKLTYPSGTATGILINSFHSPGGVAIAKKQVRCLGKYFTFSFFFSCFKWFFSGVGDNCGFDNFPSLGLKAFHNMMYFDFSMTYIGAGLICPHIVNISVLLGAIVSWGLMWPLIQNHEGDWYPAGLKSYDFKGLYGYKVFIAIAVILGDGLYNFIKISIISGRALYVHYQNRDQLPIAASEKPDAVERDDAKRTEVFLKDGVPMWIAGAGYVGLAVISIGVVPQLFTPVKWYYVLICYLIAPILAFCNAYGAGLTDWNLASSYGKLGLFVFGSWAGTQGGVLAGLAICGVMMSIVNMASDLMQDFRTGYLTLASPRSMFVSQIIGALMGCIMAPLTFWLFWKAFVLGDPNGQYKAPYALIYRSMALIGVEGFKALPAHCLQLCIGLFAAAVLINFVRDLLPKRFSQYVPIPMAMAIPFYIGGYFAIDMFLGTVIRFVYDRMNKQKSDVMTPAIAAGLICGDGVWTIPSAILALAKVDPPLCMWFFAAHSSAIPDSI